MSRYIESFQENGKTIYHEEIADLEQCRWMYNEVCCNDKSELCADFPLEGDCRICLYFEKDNGVIGSTFSE